MSEHSRLLNEIEQLNLQGMSGTREKPNFWTLHTYGWIGYYLMMVLDNLLLIGGYNHLGTNATFVLLSITFIGFLLSAPCRYLFKRCWHLSSYSQAVVIMSVAALLSVLWVVPQNLILYMAEGYDIFSLGDVPNFQWTHLFMTVSTSFSIMLVWCTLYFGINYHFRLMTVQRLQLKAARLGHLAQIRMLRYQINPHFLFNTLNAVSTLVMRGDVKGCNRILSQLAGFLRFSLDSDPEKTIPLFEELKALMLYLDIEKVRFGERLAVNFDVDESIEAAMVPSLIIQPLVENCIKHAIAHMTHDGEIRVSAWRKGWILYLQVADNGPLTDVSKINPNGVGLNNIIERLQVLYTNSHFDIALTKHKAAAPHGLSITLSLPFRED